MIVKELDPFIETGEVFARAGYQAEKQMAYYLRRAFGERKGIYVLNGLRLKRGDDAAQIDHLVIHYAGMVIIESKSAHGTLRINEHGEWIRVFGDQNQGMPSPIEQARRQAQFLKDFFNDHAPDIGGKLLGLFQTYFGLITIDVIAAISDTGIIERPKKLELPEVCKADQASTKVKELIKKHKIDVSPFKPSFNMKGGRELTRTELEKILVLLPANHIPITSVHLSATDTDEGKSQTFSLPTSVSDSFKACDVCSKPLSPKEEEFCRKNAARFGEKFYCFNHQQQHSRLASQ